MSGPPPRGRRGGQRVGIVEGWELRRDHHTDANSGGWKGLAFVVAVIAVLVVGGWFAIRPTLGPILTGLFEDNPGIIRIPVVADLLRADLADRLDKPAGNSTKAVRFVIEQGDTIAQIEENLVDDGLLTDKVAFQYLVVGDRVDQLIQAGTYTMNPSMSPRDIVTRLAADPDPPTPKMTLALRPGLRIEQIVAYLQQQADTTDLELDPSEFRKMALDPPPELIDEYQFLKKQLPKGNSLEGFLAGGVYEVPIDITADEFISMLIKQWQRDNAKLIAQARNKKVNFYDALIIASIVEREAKVDKERARIAGVYWNRLDPQVNTETAGLMQADPTVVYASDTMKLADINIKNWPDYLFWDTLGVDLNTVNVSRSLSSFQTYQNPGLPDWPIATPTHKSIVAAINPNTKKGLLYFYSCPGSDTHKFAKTAKRHARNINSCS